MEDLKIIFEIIQSIVISVGGFLALLKWLQSQHTTPARYLKVLLGEFGKDSIQKFCMEAAGGNEKELFKNEQERELAKRKTLFFFAYVNHAHKAKLISDIEFSFFERQIREVVASPAVKNELEKRAGQAVYADLLEMSRAEG